MPGIVHVEFPSEDADRAAGFWKGLFGWEFGESAMPEMDYRMAQVTEGFGAAIFPSEERSGHATIYFDTDDLDATIEKARELGGSAEDKQPIPGVGYFAAFKDTEGNTFSVFQSDESAAPPAG